MYILCTFKWPYKIIEVDFVLGRACHAVPLGSLSPRSCRCFCWYAHLVPTQARMPPMTAAPRVHPDCTCLQGVTTDKNVAVPQKTEANARPPRNNARVTRACGFVPCAPTVILDLHGGPPTALPSGMRTTTEAKVVNGFVNVVNARRSASEIVLDVFKMFPNAHAADVRDLALTTAQFVSKASLLSWTK